MALTCHEYNTVWLLFSQGITTWVNQTEWGETGASSIFWNSQSSEALKKISPSCHPPSSLLFHLIFPSMKGWMKAKSESFRRNTLLQCGHLERLPPLQHSHKPNWTNWIKTLWLPILKCIFLVYDINHIGRLHQQNATGNFRQKANAVLSMGSSGSDQISKKTRHALKKLHIFLLLD